jgi:hypothetical protein
MRSPFISFLLLVVITSCNHDVRHDGSINIFHKHSDWEVVGLKGKVKSITTRRCTIFDSAEHCHDINILKFDSLGSLVEEIDTEGRMFTYDKYFHDNDGLLLKHIFSGSDPLQPLVDTYLYSFNEDKKTCISHNPDSASGRVDTSVHLYDKSGNETEYKSSNIKEINKYDEHGFLTLSKVTWSDGNTFEVSRVNDDKGRILKRTWSDGRGSQAHVYNSDGNEIETIFFDSLGRKVNDNFIGYCEFDKNGNFLKSIDFCPQTKDMNVTRRVIEYYQ